MKSDQTKKEIELQIAIIKARLKDVKHGLDKLDYLRKKAEKEKEKYTPAR